MKNMKPIWIFAALVLAGGLILAAACAPKDEGGAAEPAPAFSPVLLLSVETEEIASVENFGVKWFSVRSEGGEEYRYDWSLGWKSEAEEPIGEYLTLDVEEDGGSRAKVTCIKRFSEEAYLKVKVRGVTRKDGSEIAVSAPITAPQMTFAEKYRGVWSDRDTDTAGDLEIAEIAVGTNGYFCDASRISDDEFYLILGEVRFQARFVQARNGKGEEIYYLRLSKMDMGDAIVEGEDVCFFKEGVDYEGVEIPGYVSPVNPEGGIQA